ncbi:cytochrome c oxidase subunit 6C-like [Littorina saxatilis]|uniref:Mitochondrial cytochrome c oxidase subunit VIc/VIIs domain-containing protein n=1 Tax=Littorina saxatilis TaxID=31220 RepID=A0AAN9BZG7_9CAEN
MFGVNVDERQPPPPKTASAGPTGPSRPQLRGLLMRQLRQHAIGAAVFVVITTVAYRIGMVSARRNRYLEFYRTYDPEADFERMKNAGVFKSVREDGSPGEH